MLLNTLSVAAGGALGASGRYLAGMLPYSGSFPLVTLLINLLGSALIGFVTGLSGERALTGRWLLFWKTGVCGGFTTFSTFSLEALTLLERGDYLRGGAYIALSAALCIAGVALGRACAQLVK